MALVAKLSAEREENNVVLLPPCSDSVIATIV